jgi:hypothetical protein
VPIAKYFVVVGSALAVLLLIAGWSLPEPFAHLYILKKRRIVTRRHGVVIPRDSEFGAEI